VPEGTSARLQKALPTVGWRSTPPNVLVGLFCENLTGLAPPADSSVKLLVNAGVLPNVAVLPEANVAVPPDWNVAVLPEANVAVLPEANVAVLPEANVVAAPKVAAVTKEQVPVARSQKVYVVLPPSDTASLSVLPR